MTDISTNIFLGYQGFRFGCIRFWTQIEFYIFTVVPKIRAERTVHLENVEIFVAFKIGAFS